MANALTESKEKVLPPDQKESLRLLAEKIRTEDPVAARSLETAQNKTDALRQLRELSRDVTSGRLKAIKETDVNAVHDAIEQPFLVTTRPVEELVEKVLDKARDLNPEVKKVAIAVGGAGLLYGLWKFGGKAWDGTKKVGKGVWEFIQNSFKTALTIGAIAGTAVLGTLGVQKYMEKKKEADPDVPAA